MAREPKSERMKRIHAEALAEFQAIYDVTWPEREQARDDRRFYSIAGAQWEGPLGELFENKPRLEVNKVRGAVMRIVNEYRNNRVTVDFVGDGDESNDDLAALCDGLFRADEERSGAQEAYDCAFEEAVGGGFGAWRLCAEYEDEYDEENENQIIEIEGIPDADIRVFFDLDAKRQDKADARRCFVLCPMTKERMREEYGDENPWPVTTLIGDVSLDWVQPDLSFVTEYYRCEERTETVFTYRYVDGSEEKFSQADFDKDPALAEMLDAKGAFPVAERKVKRKQVDKYILSGDRVLEGPERIPGDEIPIVPNYGMRWYIDNVERFSGHVRLSKDPQRLKNMQLSKLADLAARSSIEKAIMGREQVAGLEGYWANDTVNDYPFLPINILFDQAGNIAPIQGPLGYTKPPQVAPAMAALLQIAEQDIQDVLGRQEQGQELLSNVSGKAVELVQQRLDMLSYVYLDNFAQAMRRSGKIWLAMARELLIEPGRKMRTLGRQGERGVAEIARPAFDAEAGDVVYENDLQKAKFDVVVDVGPATEARRSAAVRALTQLASITANPDDQRMLVHLTFRLLDIEGTDEAREYSRRVLVAMGAEKPNEEEQKQMEAAAQNQQPDPQQELLIAGAKELEARTAKAQADTEWTLARTDETRAKTAETMAGIEQKDREIAISAARDFANARAKEMGQADRPQVQ